MKVTPPLVFAALSLLCSALPLALAHRPATTGPSCDADFGSSTTALTLPDPAISWSFKHYLDCTHRAVWIQTVSPSPDQPFYVGVGIPTLERQEEVRVDALIIGPDLPALTDDEWSLIPEDVRNDPVWSMNDGNMGAYFHASPQDQSSCDHLGTVMKDESSVVDGRCDFYEPFGSTHSWRVLDADNNLLVQEGATYYVSVFLQQDTSAKIGIALGTWVENFVTPYDLDTPSCERNLGDFAEKQGSEEECFPVVSCPTASRPIGCEDAADSAASVCELGQVCDDEVTDCVIAGIEYQTPMMGACGGERCPAAVHVWEQINEKMHTGMVDLEYTGNADVDFVRGMIPHHIGAVDMCEGLLTDLTCTEITDIDTLEGLVHFCNHVQLEQDIEVIGLRSWLAQNNLTEIASCTGMSMATSRQQDMDSTVLTMQMAESCGNLSTSSSKQLVKLNNKMHDKMAVKYSCDHSLDFTRQMVPHHAGAIDMCGILMETTEDAYLIELCENITLTQRAEIVWMTDWLQARNHTPIAPCDEDCAVDEIMSLAPLFCEDTLSTSSFCHGIAGNSQDGYCRCDEETFAANGYQCGEPTWVEGTGLFMPGVFCKRSCGLCPTDARPVWLPDCTSSGSRDDHGGDMDDMDDMDDMNHSDIDEMDEMDDMNHSDMDHGNHSVAMVGDDMAGEEGGNTILEAISGGLAHHGLMPTFFVSCLASLTVILL